MGTIQKTVWTFLLFLSLVPACTTEQSLEERQRDDTTRTYERLNTASGTYTGYVFNSPTEVTPAAIEVLVAKNPSSTNYTPTINVGLRLGLFDGITVASTSANYDWGASELVATFARKPADPSGKGGGSGGIELRGTLVEGKLTQATLVGPHIGKRTLVLAKGGQSLFEMGAERTFKINWAANPADPPLAGAMKIKNNSIALTAPDTSDLPYLPGLEVSLELEPFAITPQASKQAFYDPIFGTLDVQLTDVTWLKVSGLSLSLADYQAHSAEGELILSGAMVRKVRLESTSTPPDLKTLPFSTYLGTYQGSPKSIVLKAVAYLSYLGNSGTNKLELAFPTFPRMRMEVDICNGSEVFNQTVLKLESLDYLGQKALFQREDSTRDPLEVVFQNDWSRLLGTFLQVDPHAGGGRAKVILRPNESVKDFGCGAK